LFPNAIEPPPGQHLDGTGDKLNGAEDDPERGIRQCVAFLTDWNKTPHA
jgi:hypothetical protein